MTRLGFTSLSFLTLIFVPRIALAVGSAEVYTNASYGYGRMEARIRFAAGDGVVSSFFLWKNGSEVSGTFWNELDFEKLGADCHVETNAIFGNPSTNHSQRATIAGDACGGYHTYAYEWTPEAIAWSVDGVEIRRETGATATAFADNAATSGMQARFNVWPGDASFGGNFNPAILPVHEYVDWVQFSTYQNGAFSMQWREDFNGAALPSGWLAGNWGSPKSLSTHNARNANIVDGFLVLSLTADDALGPAGAMPGSSGGMGGSPGGGSGGAGAGASSGGTGVVAGSGGWSGAAGSVGTGGTAGSTAGANSGGTGNGAATNGGAGAGAVSSGGGSGADSNGGTGAGVAGGSDSGASNSERSERSEDAGGCTLGAPPKEGSSGLFHAVGLAAIAVAARRRLRKTIAL